MSPRRSIVFLAVNASYSHSSLAAWCLQSVVDRQAWAWQTVEVTINDDPRVVAERIIEGRPNVLGATLYLFNRRFVETVLAAVRSALPATRIVVGGPECLGENRRMIMDDRIAHAAVRGEGEMALPALLQAIDAPEAWPTIPGLCTAANGEYHDNGWADTVGDLDALPSFYATVLPGFRKPFVQLETSRGCENGCLFCTSRETPVRVRSLERIRADMECIRSHGVRRVRVVDRTFNASAGRALDLVRMFRDEFAGVEFHLEIDPARVSERLADEMAAAGPGRFHLEAGVQSLSEGVHAAICRQATARRTREGLERLCARPELAVHVDLIAGLPGGSLRDLEHDVAALIVLGPAEIQLERLKLLPGTPLARTPAQWGLEGDPEPPYAVRRTREMSEDDLVFADRLRRFLDGFYNAPALRPTVIAAVRHDDGCVSRMAREQGAVLDWATCPPLEDRFRALHRALAATANPAVRDLEWEWVRRGFSLRHGLCEARPWKQGIPEGAVLVEGDATRPCTRRWLVDLGAPHVVCYGTGPDGARCVVAVYRLQESGSQPITQRGHGSP